MNRTLKTRLLSYLRGELSPAEERELDGLLARDPSLRGELDALDAVWMNLDTVEPPPAPADFAARVLDRLGPAVAVWPAAMRWAAAGVVFSGVALGAFLGSRVSSEDPADLLYVQPSWAESYVALLEEAE